MSYHVNQLQGPANLQSINKQVKNDFHHTENRFKDVLTDALAHVNKVELDANAEMTQLATDQSTDLHNVMIAAQKATVTIEVATQVQQKAIDAYNEMMRMQV